MVSAFFTWYYLAIPGRILNYLKYWFLHLADLFSVRLCFRTFFAPWKRDVISTRGLPLKVRFQVWGMNLISRLVGAFIKLFTILTFLFSVVGWVIVSAFLFFGWLLFPLVFVLIILGFQQLIVF